MPIYPLYIDSVLLFKFIDLAYTELYNNESLFWIFIELCAVLVHMHSSPTSNCCTLCIILYKVGKFLTIQTTKITQISTQKLDTNLQMYFWVEISLEVLKFHR